MSELLKYLPCEAEEDDFSFAYEYYDKETDSIAYQCVPKHLSINDLKQEVYSKWMTVNYSSCDVKLQLYKLWKLLNQNNKFIMLFNKLTKDKDETDPDVKKVQETAFKLRSYMSMIKSLYIEMNVLQFNANHIAFDDKNRFRREVAKYILHEPL